MWCKYKEKKSLHGHSHFVEGINTALGLLSEFRELRTKRGRASEKYRKKAGRFSDFRLGTRRPRIQEHTIRGGEWLFPLFTLSKKRKNTTWYQCSLFRICVTNSPKNVLHRAKTRQSEGDRRIFLTVAHADPKRFKSYFSLKHSSLFSLGWLPISNESVLKWSVVRRAFGFTPLERLSGRRWAREMERERRRGPERSLDWHDRQKDANFVEQQCTCLRFNLHGSHLLSSLSLLLWKHLSFSGAVSMSYRQTDPSGPQHVVAVSGGERGPDWSRMTHHYRSDHQGAGPGAHIRGSLTHYCNAGLLLDSRKVAWAFKWYLISQRWAFIIINDSISVITEPLSLDWGY